MTTARRAMDSPVANPRQPLLTQRMMRECAGGTAACAMICCCSPIAVMHFLVLVVYKVPTGLCRKAWRKKKKKRLMKKTMMMIAATPEEESQTAGELAGSNGRRSSGTTFSEELADEVEEGSGGDDEDDGFETDMWDRFREGGFWRSPLDREE